MKKQLFLLLLMCGATMCSAQYGFVVTAPQSDVTTSCGASCQPFIRNHQSAQSYANEGVNQPFLYRADESISLADSQLPYSYRPGRVPEAQPAVFDTMGYYTVYLRPLNGTDTLITVWVHAAGPQCGYDLTAVDQDGNVYHTVRIGSHCWTRENLVTLHYAQDGSEVPGAAVYYADLSPDVTGNLATYGRLYSWYSAVKVPENDNVAIPYADVRGHVQGICPAGWHLPAQSEFEQLMAFTADELKSTETWIDHSGNNRSGYSAVAAGCYNGNRFENLGGSTYFWNSTHTAGSASSSALSLTFGCTEGLMQQVTDHYKVSVRCVQD